MKATSVHPRGSLRRLLVAAALAVAFTPTSQLSAQEDVGTPCERYTTHPVTFVGVADEPVRRSFTVASDVGPVRLLVTPMTVVRGYRGVGDPVVYLQLDPLPALASGRTYLVYGYNNFGNARDLVTPGGTPKEIEQAADDLAFLDSAQSQTSGTIHGTLVAGRQDDGSAARAPVPGTTIRLSAEGFRADTVTDERGRFAAAGVPEGRIRIEPLLTDGWTVSAGSVDLPRGGCATFNLVAELNGRIRGRVLHPNGTPWTWLVDLVPAESRPSATTSAQRSVRANERGEFEFTGLQPGKYLVGVNLTRAPSTSTPYPATYYPGKPSRDEAVAVVVGAGTLRNGIDITLPAPIATGELEVHVLGAAGPVEASVCVCANGNAIGTYPLQEAGRALTLAVVAGVKYRLLAHVERASGDLESNVVDVSGAPGRQVVTLRATTPAPAHPAEHPCYSFFSR